MPSLPSILKTWLLIFQCLYGLTETTACVFQSVEGDSIDVVAETVGYIQDHVEVKVCIENLIRLRLSIIYVCCYILNWNIFPVYIS